jgi:hypothetical protein
LIPVTLVGTANLDEYCHELQLRMEYSAGRIA